MFMDSVQGISDGSRRRVRPRRRLAAAALGMLLFAGAAFASESLESARKQIQSMGGSYFTEDTWMRLLDELDEIRLQADNRSDWNEAVQAGVLQATAYSQLRGDTTRALALLEKLKLQYEPYAVPEIRQVYLMEAELYSALGDAQAVSRLIYAFQNSPAYDGKAFQYRGGTRPGDPLVILRPAEKGSTSITVTAMEKLRRQAQVGRDRPLESLRITDNRGREYDLASLPWKVTLLDFWLGAWVPWRNNLPYVAEAYEEYHDRGFGVIGLSMDADPSAGMALLKKLGAEWPQADGQGRAIAGAFGFYGEACNILVDDRGYVLARNVRGADIGALVRKALEIPDGRWGHEK